MSDQSAFGPDLTDALTRARRLRGWTQAQLAEHLGVGQQTISRWESGAARPRPAMVHRLAELLGLPPLDLLRGAGYVMEDPTPLGSERAVPPAVVERPGQLPLGYLSWDRFEGFCLDLVAALPGVIRAHQYGGQGSTKLGIDLYADLDDGRRFTFQCKRRAKFDRTGVTKALAAHKYPGDRHFILVSCVAATSARDAIDQNSSWELWDVQDLSRIVRELDSSDARRIVETHFGPRWRADFLGLSGVEPFISPRKFFEPLLSRNRLFSHGWSLVGRDGPLSELEGFAMSQDRRIAVLPGRGGIGKTRLLYGLASRLETDPTAPMVRFLNEEVPLEPATLDELPDRECLVVVDDAHRRRDLALLFTAARRRKHTTKILLSIRPQGRNEVDSQLAACGLDVSEIQWLDELSELDRADVERLASEVMGAESAQSAHLAEITRDCPLVTVVGGRLLAQGQIPAAALERHIDFRRTVLSRFRDALVGDFGSQVDPRLIKSTLELVSAIQPIQLGNQPLQEASARFLGSSTDVVMRALGLLEDVGVLLRRGRSLRIVPDVLADHILHEASVTQQGHPTGYARRVFEALGAFAPAQLLRNLAELDWRLRSADGRSSTLLTEIWDTLRRAFAAASSLERCQILDWLGDVAYYQPQWVIDLAEIAIKNPTTDEDVGRAKLTVGHDNVLMRLPRLLRGAGYSVEYLEQCCDLLWELGRNDVRPTNPHPEHAMRVLADLASYDPRKPSQFNSAVVNKAMAWLQDPDTSNSVHSPFDVLDQVMVKNSYTTHSDGHAVRFQQFQVNFANTETLRSRVLETAFKEAYSSDLRRALRALETIEKALHDPTPLFNQAITIDDCLRWEPEQLRIIEGLGTLARDTTRDPLIHLKVKSILPWHAEKSESSRVRSSAKRVLDSLPASFELRLTSALIGRENWDPVEGSLEDPTKSYEEHFKRVTANQETLAREFLAHYREPNHALNMLEERLGSIRRTGQYLQPMLFIEALAKADVAFAEKMCRAVISGQSDLILDYLYILLGVIRNHNPAVASTLAQEAISTERPSIYRAVAAGYFGTRWGSVPAGAGDLRLIEFLLNQPEVDVRAAAIQACAALYTMEPQRSIDFLLKVDIGSSTLLAQALSSLFTAYGPVRLATLSDAQLEALLRKLVETETLDDYNVQHLLVEAANRSPRMTVRTLIHRIRRSEDAGSDYRPLPYTWAVEGMVNVAETNEAEAILSDILDLSMRETWQCRFWTPKLFHAVSGDIGPEVLTLLQRWIGLDDGRLIAVSNLLSGAPSSFVLMRTDFVAQLLQRAAAVGEDCLNQVRSALFGSAVSGVRSAAPGQPFREDVERRDQAASIAARMAPGSPAQRFYADLVSDAQRSIEDKLARDDELLD